MGDEDGKAAKDQKEEGESENPVRYPDQQWMDLGMQKGVTYRGGALNCNDHGVLMERGLSHSLGAYYQQRELANCAFLTPATRISRSSTRFAPSICTVDLA
jgi:hypothetical protein